MKRPAQARSGSHPVPDELLAAGCGWHSDSSSNDLGPNSFEHAKVRARHPRADLAKADAFAAKLENRVAGRSEPPLLEGLHGVEHGDVEPFDHARQDVGTERGLVGVDADPPDVFLFRRRERAKSATPGDVEHRSRSSRDLTERDRLALLRVEKVVRIRDHRADTWVGPTSTRSVSGDVGIHRRDRVAADGADHVLPWPPVL